MPEAQQPQSAGLLANQEMELTKRGAKPQRTMPRFAIRAALRSSFPVR